MLRRFFTCLLLFSAILPLKGQDQRVIDSLLNSYKRTSDDSLRVFILRDLSWEYILTKTDTALTIANKALNLAKQIKNDNGMAKSYSQLGSVYFYQSKYPEAIENFMNALKINEKIMDRNAMLKNLNNIGAIHSNSENYETALDYFRKAYLLATELDDEASAISALINIGVNFNKTHRYDEAISSLNSALNLKPDDGLLADIYLNLGGSYLDLENFSEAKEVLNKALVLASKLDANETKAFALASLSIISEKEGQSEQAKQMAHEALELAREVGLPEIEQICLDLLAKYYARTKDFEKAYLYRTEFMQLKDAIFNSEKSKILFEAETKYQVEYKEKENEILRKNGQIQELELEKRNTDIRNQQMYIIVAIVGIVLMVLLALLIYSRFLLKKKANEELSSAFKIISEKNKDITDSMSYARDLQDALLPKMSLFKNNFADSFVLFRPKDIVSGDFFWMDLKDDQVFFAVADCTGHGVPAAIVSVVAINGLSRSVNEFNITDPGKILDKLNFYVEDAFRNSEREIMDGLDIALCNISLKQKQNNSYSINFSGANNPIWIFRNAALLNGDHEDWEIIDGFALRELKGNKQPVGKFEKRTPFLSTDFQVMKDDSIYLFSDGYADQFGGKDGKKFKYARLKKFLVSIQHSPMHEQNILLSERFDSWKGTLEQIDDVCVMGIRI